MDDQPTCGKGLAEHSTLPATLARLLEATAVVLETHQKALVMEDENARREHDAYGKVAQAHRSLASQLQRSPIRWPDIATSRWARMINA